MTDSSPSSSAPPPKSGWFDRLKAGLSKSSAKIAEGLTGVFTKRKLDLASLQELEDALIEADMGPKAAAELSRRFAARTFDKGMASDDLKRILAEEIAAILRPHARSLVLSEAKPHVILVAGVNGSGKTTSIAKLAHRYHRQGKRVMLAAGDTFRAAAVEQLQVWGQRIGLPVLTTKPGGDAAGLAYEALKQAKAEGCDVLLIDTAGRLQNKADLMAELEKIIRVLGKLDPAAPQDRLLVLDAVTGQNAHAQVEIFDKAASLTGLIVTKLDGSARGGVLVALAERFSLPIYEIGFGESIDDLKPFDADAFAASLLGIPYSRAPSS